MKTCAEAKAYIEYQLSDDYDKYKSESFTHNENYNYLNNAWHYGKIELNELLDFIYEEKTKQELSKAQEVPPNTRYDAE